VHALHEYLLTTPYHAVLPHVPGETVYRRDRPRAVDRQYLVAGQH
jgi:hypothetical protein